MAPSAVGGTALFQWIVAPLDGSPLGEQALPYVAQLAGALRIPVLLVTAAHIETFAMSDPVTGGVPASAELLQQIMDEELGAVRAYLARVRERLEAQGLQVETKADFGYPAGFILDAIKEKPGTLIVLTSHGRSGVVRMALGSVADQIVRTSGRPVVVVRPAGEGTGPREAPIRRLLATLDGSPTSEQVLPATIVLARELGAEVVLLRVAESEAEVAGARDYLNGVAGKLGAEGVTAAVRVATGHPAETILSVAADAGVDLIAMATHGRSGLTRWLMGSTTDKVLHATTHPLLLVREHAEP